MIIKRTSLTDDTGRDYMNPADKAEQIIVKPAVPDPTIRQMFGNFTRATARFVKAGFPTVSEATYRERLGKCRKCPQGLWDEDARLGYGRCRHASCGCGKLKQLMATEQCPIGEWPAVSRQLT